MKIVRLRGKKWELPEVLPEKYGHSIDLFHYYFWKEIDFRKPLKDEYFVSGAIPEIYRSSRNLSQEYLVVTLLRRAIRKTIWV